MRATRIATGVGIVRCSTPTSVACGQPCWMLGSKGLVGKGW